MSTWQDLKNNPRLRRIYTMRLDIIRQIREFFWEQDFLETTTPAAVRYASQEPYLNPPSLTLHNPRGLANQLFLRTSPEYALKKLLAAGFPKIFELAVCFRDGESFGGTHNPEFTLLEWYRAPGTSDDFMADTERLFTYVGAHCDLDTLSYRGRTVPVMGPWERTSLKALWQQHLGVNLDDYLSTEPLRALCASRGYQLPADVPYEDVFFKIFLNEIEPQLGLTRPLFVYDYPLQLCSLSRPRPDTRYGERAELYIAGLEIANGFGELLDAGEQARRLEADRALRAHLNKPVWPVDPDFIAALEFGIPSPAAGIALGVDRMVLLFTGAQDINEVIFGSLGDQFPV